MSDEMQEILNDFLTESNEMLEVLDQRFVTLETDPNNTDLLNEIFRAMHSMKGSAGFLGFNHLVDVAHRGEGLSGAPGHVGFLLGYPPSLPRFTAPER